ncbi:MAG: hypothetical protein RBU21_16940 [FCB group bacterium]|nr:hypothetical protein [FCB group bacterium]
MNSKGISIDATTFLFRVYITVQSLAGGISDADLERLRGMGIGSVVLESYRGGLSLDEAALVAARDRFRAAGFETLGGLMPVAGEGFGKKGEGAEVRLGFFCYSAEETVAALEGEIRKLSRVFDQVVIDDAFLTSCRCDGCEKVRAGRPWPEFRRDLLCGVAERWARAAHEEKAAVNFTVKFPQYYDRLHLFGYDAERFPRIFDSVWIGTETRNPETPRFGYTEPYQGYFNELWMRACAGDKFEGGWFDYLDCDDTLFYQQAMTTSLAGPRRVALFCFGAELFERMPKVVAAKDKLDLLAAMGGDVRGVHVIKPPNGDGGNDLFIYDYLGMMGIPCVPATRVEAGMRSVVVPTQAMADPKTPEAVARVLDAGGQVIVTHGALLRLAEHPEVLRRFGYRPMDVAALRTEVTGFDLAGQRLQAEAPFHIAGDLMPDAETQVPVSAVFGTWTGNRLVPLVTVKPQASGGRAVVWNVETFGHDAYTLEEYLCVPVRVELMRLPAAVVTALRNVAIEPLGIRVDAPPRVGMYMSGDRVCFVNYRNEPAEVRTTGFGAAAERMTLEPSGFVQQPIDKPAQR